MPSRLATCKQANADFIEAHQFWASEANAASLLQRDDLATAFSAQSELAFEHLRALLSFRDAFPDPDHAPDTLWGSFIANCIAYFDESDDFFQLAEDERWGDTH